MGLGGKDNLLGNTGKVIRDRMISGKFRRDVGLFVGESPTEKIRDLRAVASGNAHNLDFYEMRTKCLEKKRLFEDPYFDADSSVLFFSSGPKAIVWLRPGDIVDEPRLIVEGSARFDAVQGDLGDCWFVSAVALLAQRDELFYRVVPPDQSFTEKYAGIFHFQFWQYGRWRDVVIDDRLPTVFDSSAPKKRRLVYMRSASNNEFWSALLEKAYAKLYRYYGALDGGNTGDGLEDLTGGLTEVFNLKNPPTNLEQIMLRGFEMESLFGCAIKKDPLEREKKQANGLVMGHAYSITGMRETKHGSYLLRIRNPWGHKEWNGDWSDNSPIWNSQTDAIKRSMGMIQDNGKWKFKDDGEFWMILEDFKHNFDEMQICNLGSDVMNEVNQMTGVKASKQVWAANTHYDEWSISKKTAGGCRNHRDTFANNPQIRVQLTDSNIDGNDKKCTVIFALMQTHRKRNVNTEDPDKVHIGFGVYNAGSVSGHLPMQFFTDKNRILRTAIFYNSREVTLDCRIPPGNYVVVPSTHDPNLNAKFIFRIYTKGIIKSQQL